MGRSGVQAPNIEQGWRGSSHLSTPSQLPSPLPTCFDSLQHHPSFAVVKDLVPGRSVPVGWPIQPRFSSVNGLSRVELVLPSGSDLYGMGEVNGPLRRNGTQTILWNTDNYAYKKDEGKRLYQAHPWVMGLRKDGSAFGIVADNSWKQEFHLGDTLRIVSEGPPFRVLVLEAASPDGLLELLGEYTGRMEMPPLWALGYQQCRYSYTPDTRVLEIAGELRKRQIPADVIWMDIDYMQSYKVFTFDSIQFPNPVKLNNKLHTLNFKSVYMIDPGVKKEAGYFVFDEGTRGNHWVLDSAGQPYIGKVWPGDCLFPDFTRPETRHWWAGLYKDFMATGIDGVWNDMNEPAVFNGPDGTMPLNNRHRGGAGLPAASHLRYHNVYGMLMVQASRDGIARANPGKRPFVLSRASFLGGQRFAATWTGDNLSTREHLELATPMLLNLGLSGQPFSGPDLGGFSGNADSALFADWISVGAFYPFCRNHSSKSSSNQEPWVFGARVEGVAKRALLRRYRLLPYLYHAFYEAATKGWPIMRPVFWDDPADTTLRREEQAFLWGDNLLIVPRWSLFQPGSRWESLSIPDVDMPEDTIQAAIYMRKGALIPITQRNIYHTGAMSMDSLLLLSHFDERGRSVGFVYMDDGESMNYKKGNFALLKVNARRKRKGTIKWKVRRISGHAPYSTNSWKMQSVN